MALKVLECFICRWRVIEERSFCVFSDIIFLAKNKILKLLRNMCLATFSRPANTEHTSPRQSLSMDEKFQSSFFRHICHLIYKFSLISKESYLYFTRSSWNQLPKFLNIMERKQYNFKSEKKKGKRNYLIYFLYTESQYLENLFCFFAWQPVLLLFS